MDKKGVFPSAKKEGERVSPFLHPDEKNYEQWRSGEKRFLCPMSRREEKRKEEVDVRMSGIRGEKRGRERFHPRNPGPQEKGGEWPPYSLQKKGGEGRKSCPYDRKIHKGGSKNDNLPHLGEMGEKEGKREKKIPHPLDREGEKRKPLLPNSGGKGCAAKRGPAVSPPGREGKGKGGKKLVHHSTRPRSKVAGVTVEPGRREKRKIKTSTYFLPIPNYKFKGGGDRRRLILIHFFGVRQNEKKKKKREEKGCLQIPDSIHSTDPVPLRKG